jgi:hypothetical protein
MMLGAGINPVGLIGNLSTRYEDGKTKNMYSGITDVVQDTLGLNTGKGKSIGDAVEIINDPAGYLSRNIDTVGKSVPDLGPIEDVKAEQARQADIAYNLNENRTADDMSKEFKTRVYDESLYPRYETKTQLPTDEKFTGDPRGIAFYSPRGTTQTSSQDDLSLGSLAPDPREAPEQNMFEKGINSVVDLFGGPQAASRNNIDTSFGSGNDQPDRRRVVQAAVPTPSIVEEDEELTGIKGLLAKRKPVASRRDSNKFSKLLLSSLYPNQNINLG